MEPESSLDDSRPQQRHETTVTVRCTGHVRDAVGTHELKYTFEGTTLRAFLEAFFDEYAVEDLLIAETEAEATAHGWAPVPEELPGTWRKNPEANRRVPSPASASTGGSTNISKGSRRNSRTVIASRCSIRSCSVVEWLSKVVYRISGTVGSRHREWRTRCSSPPTERIRLRP